MPRDVPRPGPIFPMIFRALLLSIALTSAVSGAAGESRNSNEKQVLATIDALNQAGLHRDVPRLKSLYSAQYFHTNPDGSVMQLADVLASYSKATPFKFDSSSADERRVVVPAAGRLHHR